MPAQPAPDIIAGPELEKLRADRGLRPLNKDEEGWNLYDLKGGVFGFTYAPGLKEVPVYSKQHYHGFEVHKLKTGEVHLIGFVSPADKAAVSAPTGTVQTAIFPQPWPDKDATELVSVADTRMQPAKKAINREDGNPFRTLVFPG
jgi:hypothetical protein